MWVPANSGKKRVAIDPRIQEVEPESSDINMDFIRRG